MDTTLFGWENDKDNNFETATDKESNGIEALIIYGKRLKIVKEAHWRSTG